MAIKTIYHLEALTGGTDSTYLDYADGNSLSDGDRAYVIASDVFYAYRLNATSGAAESSPNVIAPDTNPGNKRWILVTTYSLTAVTTSVTAADNDSDTSIATTAFAKSQDAVLAREPDQGVALTAAASGSSGITVADDDDIDFGTGNFTLVWKGSLPDWTPSTDYQRFFSKYQGDVFIDFYVRSDGSLGILFGTTGPVTKTIASGIPTFVDGTVHEIVLAVARETASVAGSGQYYIDGTAFGSPVAISATSGGGTISNTGALYISGNVSARTAGTTHHAILYNSALTAAEVLDLYRNGVAESDKWGSQTELIPPGTGNRNLDFSVDAVDETAFNAAYAWQSTGAVTSFSVASNVFSAVANANTGLYLPNVLTEDNKAYKITLNVTSITGTWNVQTRQTAGTFTTHETITTTGKKEISYVVPSPTVATYPHFFLRSASAGATIAITAGTINNSLKRSGATLALTPEGIQPNRWLDASSNHLDATFPTTGWSLTRPIPNQPVLQNLLTNSQFMAMSGSGLTQGRTVARQTDFEVGSAIYSNDGTGTTGWTATRCAVSSAGGELIITDDGTGTTLSILRNLSGLTAGRLYKLSCKVTNGTGTWAGGAIQAANSGGTVILGVVSSQTEASQQDYSTIWEASSATDMIIFSMDVGAGETLKLDTIDVYEVTPGYVAADNTCFDGWAKDSGGPAYVWREHNGANTKDGSFYALKVTGGAGGYSEVYWPVSIQTSDFFYRKFAGRTVTFGCWVKASVANKTRIYISQSSGATYSPYHTGGGNYEWLEVTAAIAINTTLFRVYLAAAPTTETQTAYFSQPMLVYGSSIGQGNYQPIVNEVIWLQSNVDLMSNATATSGAVTLNVEATSSGAIGKGVKVLKGHVKGENSAAEKYLIVGMADSVYEDGLISQVAAGTLMNRMDSRTDANGDLHVTAQDANWTAVYIRVTGIQT